MPESKGPSTKLHAITPTDVASWPSEISKLNPVPEIYFSALGTSRAAAGSVEAQRKIDLDLNLTMAREAQKAGTKICVLISSAGSNATSYIPYAKMKGELEDAVKELGFKTTIILRPGLLVGNRSERGIGQYAAGTVAGFMGSISPGLKDMWAQDADCVARAAVKSGLMALEGQALEGQTTGSTWLLSQADIVKLGKRESNIP